jgi:hypothetical protein
MAQSLPQNQSQPHGAIMQALSKDVAALQRLVNASIAALRNAAASSGSLPSPPQPSTASSVGDSNLGASGSYPMLTSGQSTGRATPGLPMTAQLF